MLNWIKKLYNNHYHPQTVTVKIPVGRSWSKDYCEITYIANTDKQKLKAQMMVENGRDIDEKGNKLLASCNLLEVERELGLKRHNKRDENGQIIPAVHTFSSGFGGYDSYELWLRGSRVTVFGAHKWSKDWNGIEPCEDDGFYKMEEGTRKQFMAMQIKNYFHPQPSSATPAIQPA